MAKNRAI